MNRTMRLFVLIYFFICSTVVSNTAYTVKDDGDAGFRSNRLETITGMMPGPLHFPSGCKFHRRCPIGSGDKRCQNVEPVLREVQPGWCVACWYARGYGK